LRSPQDLDFETMLKHLPLRFTLLASLLGMATSFFAQTHTHDGVTPCAINHAEEMLFFQRPETRAAAEEATRKLELETQQGEVAGQREDLLIIPVVFHVIHFNGPENISTAQVHDAVDVLNTNFRALNETVTEVIPEFEDLVADVEIEFRLAQRDPNGNCHPGINRIVSDLTYVGDSEMKSLIQWPRNKYLNVWVCEYAAGAAGYALYPGSVNGNQNADQDGIVLQHTYCGSIGTSNVYRSRTLTHEVGHWLNLRHTWGNSNNPGLAENCDEDDNVTDTPNTLGWTSCVLDGTTCGSLDNVQNYMEYSYCGRMFTEGQKARMRTALQSTTAQRNQLSTSSNLQSTGVAGEDILCEAVFDTDRQVICVGDSVRFTDQSYHGATMWSWNFGDGSGAAGGVSDPVQELYHTFNTPGLYDVSLTVANGSEEASTTVEGAVYVMAAGEMEMPLTQGFENGEFPDPQWFIEDPLNDGTWELTTDGAATGNRSMFIENWGNTIEFNDDFLRTATLDMSGMQEIHVSYKWAYVYKGNSEASETDDRLRVSVTGDCGNDWDLRRMHRGFTDLPTADPHPFPWAPADASEWKEYTIVLDNEQYMTEFFRVQFEFESRLGNNIYLDDINVQGFEGTESVGTMEGLAQSWMLAPNPASQASSLSFQTRNPGNATLTLQDASGRLLSSTTRAVSAGMQQWQLEAPATQGVYFVRLETADAAQRTWRWVIQ
jgi:PKD repeat protein